VGQAALVRLPDPFSLRFSSRIRLAALSSVVPPAGFDRRRVNSSARSFQELPSRQSRRLDRASSAVELLVQRATVEVLNGIYETDFLGFSYGYRQGKSPHNALDALYTGLLTRKVNWVLDGDINSFFDGLDHEWLIKFIEHGIADQRVGRLIRKVAERRRAGRRRVEVQ